MIEVYYKDIGNVIFWMNLYYILFSHVMKILKHILAQTLNKLNNTHKIHTKKLNNNNNTI